MERYAREPLSVGVGGRLGARADQVAGRAYITMGVLRVTILINGIISFLGELWGLSAA